MVAGTILSLNKNRANYEYFRPTQPTFPYNDNLVEQFYEDMTETMKK